MNSIIVRFKPLVIIGTFECFKSNKIYLGGRGPGGVPFVPGFGVDGGTGLAGAAVLVEERVRETFISFLLR
jgi:hypothetical protein